MTYTIKDLLEALQSPITNSPHLANNAETWSRIGNRDSFDELGLTPSELDDFLKEWIEDNPYKNI